MNCEAVRHYPRVLSIAGSDSSGGAGIQADLKTFAALGCFGMTAVTALTAQNSTGVRAIHAVPPDILRAQIDAVVEDIGVDAVKIGMLHSPAIVRTVAQAIDRHQMHCVVFDPVMVASSGVRLLTDEALAVLVAELLPRVTLITPNLDEAAVLVGRPLTGVDDMAQAAQALRAMGARAVLLKGGHLAGDTVTDLLLGADHVPVWMPAPRIITANARGTGCTLSSAIAAHLALGAALPQAVALARQFVRQALLAGVGVRTGQAGGPLNHGFAPRAMRASQ